MTQSELREILCERIKIANNKNLPVEQRQAENKITQTILEIAQLVFDDNTKSTKTVTPPAAEHTAVNWGLFAETDSSYSDKRRHPFGDSQKLWLIENFRLQPNMGALARAYNECFGTNVTSRFIKEKCKFYGFIK